jgi:signal transduction histidine kinase
MRFTKVLDVLLDNAVKFTPAGTRIRVAIGPDADDPRRVQVTFSDDGPGIPREELSRIFQPFFQVDGSTTRTAGGLGIGLAVARRLIAAMDGEIHADAPPEGGTSFRILLPAP